MRHPLLLFCLILGMSPIMSNAYARADTVTCEYQYVLGDNDTKHDARKIAFIEAKRRCAEQIGTLLASETIVSSSDLTKDEIRAYSLSFMKTEQVSESFLPSGEGLAVLVKLKAQYDSDLTNARLKELLSDRGKSQEFKHTQEQILALEKQVINLQRQLGETKPDEQIIRLREERNMVLSQYDTIVHNLENLNARTQEYAHCGMTMDEIRSVLGPPIPRAARDWHKTCCDTETWNYGKQWLKFQGGVVVGIAENDSVPEEGQGCRALKPNVVNKSDLSALKKPADNIPTFEAYLTEQERSKASQSSTSKGASNKELEEHQRAKEMLSMWHPDWQKIVGPKGSMTPYRIWLARQPEAYRTKIEGSRDPTDISLSIDKFKAETK